MTTLLLDLLAPLICLGAMMFDGVLYILSLPWWVLAPAVTGMTIYVIRNP